MTRRLAAALLFLVASCNIQFSRPEADQWQKGSIHWDHMPLSLYWDHNEFPDYNEGIAAAANLWNKEVGCPVFKIVDSPIGADVTIGSGDSVTCAGPSFAPESDAGRHAWATTVYCPAVLKVEIQLRQLGDIQTMYVVDQHELGHALGLAHDYGGIMKPQIGEFDLPRVFVPDSDDVVRLRARYCR